MSVIVDLYAETAKLREQTLDLLFSGIAAHVSELFVFIPG